MGKNGNIRHLVLLSALILITGFAAPKRGFCADAPARPGEKGGTLISGQALAADGGAVTGVVAIETGRLYSKNYRYGGKVDEKGRFSVTVPEGGDYGLHIYATGYVYFPVGIEVKTGEDNQFTYTVPPNPAATEAPSITDVQFGRSTEAPDRVVIKLFVNDPNENLSHQVLGINIRTQESFMFSPPGIVLPGTKNFPNGEYTLIYDTRGRRFDPAEWLFLAADNRCYNSAILQHPFTEKSILPARAPGEAVPPVATGKPGGGLDEKALRELGKNVFDNNCAICHYRDKTKIKVGPGLQGIFRRTLTPVYQVPVTEENIRAQIEKGSENMPPYTHITGEALDGLVMYLKTL